MFTGLIETLGTVVSVDRKGTSVVLGIEPDSSPFEASDGSSVAIDGVCLTVERKRGAILVFSAVRETLSRTSLCSCVMGRRVNLERALRLSDRLDGHLVLGHVDGLGSIVGDEDVQGSILRTIAVPVELQPFMAEKGSVAIDGVSLTIAKSSAATLTVSIIPATLQRTTMQLKKTGDFVNLECDIVARYLYRFTKFNTANGSSSVESDSLINKLERFGF
jgi:riboflavin synthase alpha subunit